MKRSVPRQATIIDAGLLVVVVVVVVVGMSFLLPLEFGQLGNRASASPVAPSASPAAPSASPRPNAPSASPVDQSASPVDQWGPLAVMRPQGGADTGRAEGTLRITDRCVFLDEAGAVSLLAWPADRTTWDAQSRIIAFENVDGRIATVRNGDRVVLGGGGDSEAESGISGEDWVKRMEWVAPPASTCSLDPRWVVGAVAGVAS